MFLQFNVSGDKLIIEMVGELDHHSAEEVRAKIDNKIDENRI